MSPLPEDAPPRHPWLAPAGLCILALVCFWPLTTHPADVLVGTVRNGLNDVTGYYIGQRDWPRLSLTRWHELPFWNPTSAGGAPYLGNPQAAFYYPPSWLFWIVPARGAISWVMVAHHLIAGLGMYGLARKLGATRLGAFTAGAALLASPVLLARTSEGHLGTLGAVAWAPWAFWMYERYRTAERPRGLGLAAALALSMLAGHIQESYYLVLSLTALCLFDALRLARRGARDQARRLLLRWPLVGLVTAGLTAAELLPMAIFAQQSARTAGLFGGIASTSSAGPASLLQLFNPFAFGSPESYQGPGTYFWESLCHFGVVPLVLAVFGLLARTGARRVGVVGLVALLFALGGNTPLYPLLHKVVPGVSLFRFPSRALFLAALAVSLLSGFGVDTVAGWARAGAEQPCRTLWRGYRVLGALLALAVVAALLSAPGGAVVARDALVKARPWVWSGLALGLCAAAVNQPRWAGRCALGLAALLMVELVGFASAILRTVPPGSLRGASAVTERLEESGQVGRILARQQAVSDREAERRGWLKVEGYDPIPLRRTLALVGAAGLDSNPVQGLFGIKPLELSGASKGLIDLLGVRYAVLLKNDDAPETFGWKLVETCRVPELVALRGETPRLLECRIMENPSALPRAFVVGAARVPKAGDDIKAALQALDPKSEVLLDRDLLGTGPRQEFAPARVVEESPNRLVLAVETTRPGYLVLTDAWYPGWRATVDTYSTLVVPADLAFRAVALPNAGRHQVVFEYHPVGLLPGLAVSGLTLLVLVLIAGRELTGPLDDEDEPEPETPTATGPAERDS